MSREDYECLCVELEHMQQREHPREYDTLSREAKEALQYWIMHALQPATKVDELHSSYGLALAYQRETTLYVSNAQLKGAMLMAGYQPIEKGKQHWHFTIKPTYDQQHLSHEVARQHKRVRVSIYRSTPQSEQELHALVQKVLASPGGDDTYRVMM